MFENTPRFFHDCLQTLRASNTKLIRDKSYSMKSKDENLKIFFLAHDIMSFAI
jgi:hypothetical protein